MAKPWAEVAKDPGYLSLSSEDREYARRQYFDDVVAPQISTDDIEPARHQFDDDTKKSALELEQKEYEEQNSFVDRVGQRLKRGYKQTMASEYASNAADIAESIHFLSNPDDAPFIARKQIASMSPEKRQSEIEKNFDALSSSISNYAREQKELSGIPVAPVSKAAGQAKTVGEYVDAVKTSPISYIADVGLPSVVQSAPALVDAVVGSRVGGKTGGRAGAGIASAGVDYAAELSSILAKSGVDTTDPEKVKEALSSPEFIANAKKEAGLHAGVVGLFDAISFGLASKTLAPKGMRSVQRELTNVAAQIPAQGVLGAAGEAGGQLAAGQELSVGEIGGELVGEMFQAPTEVAAAAYSGVRDKVMSAPDVDTAIAAATEAAGPLALPAPTMIASPDGQVATEAQLAEREQSLGMTPDVERAVVARAEQEAEAARADTAIEGELVPRQEAPAALPAPRVIVDQDGLAATETQIQQRQQNKADLGISPDIERAIAARQPGAFIPYIRSGADTAPSANPTVSVAEIPATAPSSTAISSVPSKPIAAPKTVQASHIDEAASEAATSPSNNLPDPTPAQREAGNYKLGHVSLHGMDISIENPAGSRRRPELPPLRNHYGYLKGTVGKDKDHLDVFLTENANDPKRPVFVVDQTNKEGKFDEHKIVLGAATEQEARDAYLSNYAPGWTGLGAIKKFTLPEFKLWAKHGQTKKPVALKPVSHPAPSSGPQIDHLTRIIDDADTKLSGGRLTAAQRTLQVRRKADAQRRLAEIKASPRAELSPTNQPQPSTKGALATSGIIEELRGAGPAGIDVRTKSRTWNSMAQRLVKDGSAVVRDGRIMEQAKPVSAAPADKAERRQDTARRKRVSEMSPAEMRSSLLEDHLTGLPNRRAYEESDKKPVQVAIDADSLKWINDNFGHESGDKMLQVIGQALKEQGIDGYHLSGDEFHIQGDSQAELEQALAAVTRRLDGAKLVAQLQDGTTVTKMGVHFSYGIGGTRNEADQALNRAKAEREAKGLRSARGQTPPGVERFAAWQQTPANRVAAAQEIDEEVDRKPSAEAGRTAATEKPPKGGFSVSVVDKSSDKRLTPVSKRAASKDEPLFSRTAPNQTFYSALERGIESIQQPKAPVEQWKAIIKNLTAKGVKPEEIQWLGLDEWLDEQTGTLTKDALLEFVGANQIQVTEKMLGDEGGKEYQEASAKAAELNEKAGAILREVEKSLTPNAMSRADLRFLAQDLLLHKSAEDDARKFGVDDASIEKLKEFQETWIEFQEADERAADLRDESKTETKFSSYTLPGGENYRELLLKIPEKPLPPQSKPEWKKNDRGKWAWFIGGQQVSGAFSDEFDSQQAMSTVSRGTMRDTANFRSSHFSEPNIVAHIRFNDRTDSDGKRVLFIEEIQSDFGQKTKRSKDAISKAVDADFLGIVERMKASGEITVECD